MTFGQLQTAVYQVCGYPPPVQPPVVARVKNWLNEAHRHCLRLPGLVELRQRNGFPFVTRPGQAIYNFPVAFERVDAVVERTTHRRLRYLSRDTFRSIDPAETSQGTPTCYIPEGWQPRFAIPTTPVGTPLWVVSSSPLDTTQISRVQAIHVVGDLPFLAETPLNGTTRVPIWFEGAFIMDIVSWTLSSACQGQVRLFIDPILDSGEDESQEGPFVLSRISQGQTSVQYWCLRLWPTPSGAVTYFLDGQLEIPELIYETDIPMLPPSFHDVLAAFARMREYERTGDSRFAVAAAEWERGLGQLRATNFPDDWKPVAGSMSSVDRGSNLGAGFPADWSWP